MLSRKLGSRLFIFSGVDPETVRVEITMPQIDGNTGRGEEYSGILHVINGSDGKRSYEGDIAAYSAQAYYLDQALQHRSHKYLASGTQKPLKLVLTALDANEAHQRGYDLIGRVETAKQIVTFVASSKSGRHGILFVGKAESEYLSAPQSHTISLIPDEQQARQNVVAKVLIGNATLQTAQVK